MFLKFRCSIDIYKGVQNHHHIRPLNDNEFESGILLCRRLHFQWQTKLDDKSGVCVLVEKLLTNFLLILLAPFLFACLFSTFCTTPFHMHHHHSALMLNVCMCARVCM